MDRKAEAVSVRDCHRRTGLPLVYRGGAVRESCPCLVAEVIADVGEQPVAEGEPLALVPASDRARFDTAEISHFGGNEHESCLPLLTEHAKPEFSQWRCSELRRDTILVFIQASLCFVVGVEPRHRM